MKEEDAEMETDEVPVALAAKVIELDAGGVRAGDTEALALTVLLLLPLGCAVIVALLLLLPVGGCPLGVKLALIVTEPDREEDAVAAPLALPVLLAAGVALLLPVADAVSADVAVPLPVPLLVPVRDIVGLALGGHGQACAPSV